MKIELSELYKYFESIYHDDYYFGLHGISERPDMPEEYESLTTEEKAKNIIENGLNNNRHISIKSTCKILGRLSTSYEEEKSLTTEFIYRPYKTQDNFYVVIVAIPVVFKKSDGTIYFTGWMKPNVRYSDDISELECITDIICEDKIPKEFILGYYHYNKDDKEVEFIKNKSFCEELDEEEKDKFIEEHIESKNLMVEAFTGMMSIDTMMLLSYINKEHREPEIDVLNNIIEEHQEYLRKEPVKDEELISFKELYEGENNIKEEIINHRFKDKNLLKDIGYYSYHQIPDFTYVSYLDFEAWVKKMGNDPYKLCVYQYMLYYKELSRIYLKKIGKTTANQY